VTDHSRLPGKNHGSQAIVATMAGILPNAQHIIKTRASIESGWGGGFINDLVPEVRRIFNVSAKVDQGIVVREVSHGSPAEKAGIQTGDVIQTINQQAVKDVRGFVRRVQETQPGKTIWLRVARGDALKDVSVRVDKRQRDDYAIIQPPMLQI